MKATMTTPESGIYVICCLVNRKRYIGSSGALKNRKKSHWHALERNKHHNPILQAAWNKHGAVNFSYEVVERCALSALLEREQWWIDNDNPEFNVLKVAGSARGYKWSDEAKRRSSERHRGKIISEETRKKISIALLGRRVGATARPLKAPPPPKVRIFGPRPAEVRAKISRAHIGMRHSKESKAKISANRRGKGCGKRPKDTCLAIAKAKAMLDENQVREIRRLCHLGAPQRAVAALSGVNRVSVGQIVRGESYVWA